MAFASKWYKSTSLLKNYITKIALVLSYSPTGSETETWDASATTDGSVMCYRNGTELTVVVSSLPTELQADMFYNFRSLESITGLGSVTAIGDFAFARTPNLQEVDLVGTNILTIGDRACYLSSIEDCVDFSGVPLENIGSIATRRKRWSEQGLTDLQAISFPKSIYFDVPNPDNQNDYSDVPFGTYADGTEKSATDSGCSAFVLYHIWNYLHAGTDQQYNNWLDWFNATLNADGTWAENNVIHIGTMYEKEVSALGWTFCGEDKVDVATDLNTIIDSLNRGYPVWVGIRNNAYSDDGYHAVTIVGCDADTHRLAVLDSMTTKGDTVSVWWIAFEDMFAEGEDGSGNSDSIKIIAYANPTLAANTTWYTQGGTSVDKSTITEIEIADRYAISNATADNWDASASLDGSVWAYVEGTKLIIAGNGIGHVYANADSLGVFRDFKAMTTFNGADVFATDNATTLERAFYDCMALESLDLNSWNTANVKNLRATFNGLLALKSIAVNNWNTEATENLRGTFQCCVSLEELDLSGWVVSNVTDMQAVISSMSDYGGPMKLKKIIGIENWDVSKVTNAKTMFAFCCEVAELDLSKWTLQPTNTRGMFQDCAAIEELNLAGFDMSACNDPYNMFAYMYKLKKITLGENFNFAGDGTGSAAVLPAPDAAYIDGADGNWYTADGTAYAPANIPVAKATTYVADKTIWEQPCIIKYGTLQQLGDATREISGTNKLYTPKEMVAALRN